MCWLNTNTILEQGLSISFPLILAEETFHNLVIYTYHYLVSASWVRQFKTSIQHLYGKNILGFAGLLPCCSMTNKELMSFRPFFAFCKYDIQWVQVGQENIHSPLKRRQIVRVGQMSLVWLQNMGNLSLTNSGMV